MIDKLSHNGSTDNKRAIIFRGWLGSNSMVFKTQRLARIYISLILLDISPSRGWESEVLQPLTLSD
jgi:hypothetical protein